MTTATTVTHTRVRRPWFWTGRRYLYLNARSREPLRWGLAKRGWHYGSILKYDEDSITVNWSWGITTEPLDWYDTVWGD